jgi:GDP-L-fucose synthase
LVTAKKSNQPKVEIWGTGSPLREFLYVDDLADACMFLMKNYNEAQHVNVGSGQEISIKDLALLIKEIAGYKGEIYFNTEMPDGTPRKLLHSGLINKLGWQATTSLRKGIENVVKETADIF